MHRFAIPTANGELCRHFGHCEQFTIIDFELSSGRVIAEKCVTPPPHEPGRLPRWLHEQSVQTILAGGMGAHAQNLFQELGIHVVTGVEAGKPESLILAYSRGELVISDNRCNH
ncbi:MAG: ATPase [Calditrichaeota bacterium]|nr:MAG: ATPase [Calditrichota bacterium]